jgi:hypothetical protein
MSVGDPNRLDHIGLRLEPGAAVTVDDASITCDRAVTLRYPVFAFNPYLKEQKPELANAFMILSCDLDYIASGMTLTIQVT